MKSVELGLELHKTIEKMERLSDRVNYEKISAIKYYSRSIFDILNQMQNRTYNYEYKTKVAISKVMVALSELDKSINELENL